MKRLAAIALLLLASYASVPLPAEAAITTQAPPAGPTMVVVPYNDTVTFSADVLFDFDHAALKPEAKITLDALIEKVRGIDLDVVGAVGYTDNIDSETYNVKLPVRRVEAVKAYLVSKGVAPSRIEVEGRGTRQPVADNQSAEGRMKNRRVELEVLGTIRK